MRIIETTITPVRAKQLLGNRAPNRNIIKARIKQYADDMTDGKWTQTGDTIKVNTRGELMDGQHRLLAVVAADKPIKMFIAQGVKKDVMPNIDTHASRTPGQVLSMHGYKFSHAMAAAAKLYHAYKENIFTSGLPRFSPAKILEILDENPEMSNFAYVVRIWTPLHVGSAVSIAIPYIFSHETDADHSEIDDFIDSIAIGANLASDDPRLLFRNKVIDMHYRRLDGGGYSRTIVRAALLLKTWNFYREGKRISKLHIEKWKDGFPRAI